MEYAELLKYVPYVLVALNVLTLLVAGFTYLRVRKLARRVGEEFAKRPVVMLSDPARLSEAEVLAQWKMDLDAMGPGGVNTNKWKSIKKKIETLEKKVH